MLGGTRLTFDAHRLAKLCYEQASLSGVCQVSPVPSPHCPLWKGVTVRSPHLGASSRVTWNSCAWVGLLSPLCLFHRVFISVWTGGYLFYTLDYDPTRLYFVVQTVPALTTGGSFSWLPGPFDLLPLYLLTLLIRSSRLILYNSCCSQS